MYHVQKKINTWYLHVSWGQFWAHRFINRLFPNMDAQRDIQKS